MFQIPTLRNSAVMWDSGGDKEDYSGSGDYANYEEDDNGTSSIQFSFTNVENNRSEESVIELPADDNDKESTGGQQPRPADTEGVHVGPQARRRRGRRVRLREAEVIEKDERVLKMDEWCK